MVISVHAIYATLTIAFVAFAVGKVISNVPFDTDLSEPNAKTATAAFAALAL